MKQLKRFVLVSIAAFCPFFSTSTSAQMLADITADVETEFGTYHPYPVDIVPQVPSYTIRPDFSNVSNFDDFNFTEQERALLLENGFVATASSYKQLYDVYKALKERETPIFVTTDCMLHTFHVLYDNMLRLLEVNRFASDLDALNRAMLDKMETLYNQAEAPEVEEALKKDVAYFAVGTRLLNPAAAIPEDVVDLVEAELLLIDAHEGFDFSPIFGYQEDYSQYKPRGHYTRNELLQRYFRSMMWYGRMMFRLEPDSTEAGLKKGREETLQAIYIVKAINQLEVEGRPALEIWDEIYTPTVFFVGKADDLTIYEYTQLIEKLYGPDYQSLPLEQFADGQKLETFIQEAKKLRDPAVCSSFVWEWEEFEGVTKGFRFMGQRYIPDSHMFTELTHSQVRGRLFPMALDVFSVLGSQRASAILDSVYHQSQTYPDYPAKVDSLKVLFASFDHRVWAQNLYWNWLYSLMPLLFPKDEGYPIFMQKKAWADKELTTALGSWTELRHDTILYAKQSYTRATAMPSPLGLVQGYVEPNPYLYARLASLARFMQTGLEQRGLLIEEVEQRLSSLESLLLKLKTISEKELTNVGPDFDEYQLICSIGDSLEALVTFPPEISEQIESDTDDQMAVVADVHTDPNTGQCLEEGVGYPLNLYVITKVEGELVVTQGAILSYFEFKQPMSERLTDEQWQQMLQGGAAPDAPQWTVSFAPQGFATGQPPLAHSSESREAIALRLSVIPERPTVGEEIKIRAALSSPYQEGEPRVIIEKPEGDSVAVPLAEQDSAYVGEVTAEGWQPGQIVIKAAWVTTWAGRSHEICQSRKALVLAPETGAEEQSPSPGNFYLGQNHPNPFNAATAVPFFLPSESRVRLVIYDLLGQPVITLVNAELPRGKHRALWDGKDESGREVSSGTYFCCLKTGENTIGTRKMLLLR
ncbi:MAG: DUF3160 domain-containing protein [Candidatus Latescibacteria bacterium]|nr:DUF3160 domain-containing protein [Candidatus Latescibacterota bacterium]